VKRKIKEKTALLEEARDLYYNKRLTTSELANRYGKSVRTIYRWLNKVKQEEPSACSKPRRAVKRVKKYPPVIFNRIVVIKEELPQRSAPAVHQILKREYPANCPSLSTVRKYIRDQGLTCKPGPRKQGYIKFEREKPGDLWQIDIAGVQTVGHLGRLYLIALLDDCSRYTVAAEYFKDQKGRNILKIIRDAVLAHGRPNEILADNGAQFRNAIGELGTKYSKLLELLDVKPVFARPAHPQTKGKLERWFGVVIQMFLTEARHSVENDPGYSLASFNRVFQEWVNWYNTEKPHRSLPGKGPPAKIFFGSKDRVSRPLQTRVNWDRWLQILARRKVTKCNQISYKAHHYDIPPGYSGSRIELIEHGDRIDFYWKDQLLTSHPVHQALPRVNQKMTKRKIRLNGTVSYKNKQYTVDYKQAGKTVEIQEINHGRDLLVYLNGILIKTLKP
jgi:transposase InsO family protein